MTRFLSDIAPLALPLPITSAARQLAADFAREQPTAAKAEAVRLNTLAVAVMHDYCQMMEIPTDLAGSDSWNALMRLTSDVADLQLPGLGQLECRPLREGETVCAVPPEVWELRVGYSVVAIAADYQTAQLLGFAPAIQDGTLAISALQPPEALLDHLQTLRAAAPGESPVGRAAIRLGQWLNGVFDQGWENVEALLSGPSPLAFSFRGGDDSPPPEAGLVADVSRAKLIDLALQIGPQTVVLRVDLQAEETGSCAIRLQVHPAQPSPYLPPGLVLSVLEGDDTPFRQLRSRQADNYIQLQFSGQPGEPFRVLIQLDDAVYTEDFVI
ncbi:MAG: DUF1822 family protein [Cyanobacteria bacterium J06638_6]